MVAPETMLLPSLMALLFRTPSRTGMSAADQRQQGLASFHGLLRTGGNDSELSRSGKVRAPQFWSGDQHLPRLRMGFGKRPDRGHAIGSYPR